MYLSVSSSILNIIISEMNFFKITQKKEQGFDALLLGEKIWEIIRKWLN